jgi:hypothetical protein
MKNQVKFDKNQGLMTVKVGSREWAISREEAKSVFLLLIRNKHSKEQ